MEAQLESSNKIQVSKREKDKSKEEANMKLLDKETSIDKIKSKVEKKIQVLFNMTSLKNLEYRRLCSFYH
jgi:hypothetical protein